MLIVQVRIMCKVLGGVSADKTGCLMALNLTDWNVHRAIKLVKLKKALVQKTGIKDNEMKVRVNKRTSECLQFSFSLP